MMPPSTMPLSIEPAGRAEHTAGASAPSGKKSLQFDCCSSAGSCFASNSSCGFELGGPQRFGEHRAFRCTSQCFVDYGSWDLGCDASVIFPGDELAAQHQRADALSLSHECYAAGFLAQLGVAGSPCQAIASSCAM